MAFGPVRVSTRLRGPLLSNGDPIHLDGLLAMAWAVRHPRFASASRTTPVSELQEPHLPLALVEHAGCRVWMASAEMREAPQCPTLVWQSGRRDPEDWDRLQSPVNVQAGPSKDVLLRRQGALVQSVSWLCWGDVREVRRSLRLLWGREDRPHGAVGSARRSGSGEIEMWSCVRETFEPLDVLCAEGVLRRHVPADWLASAERLVRGAFRPPYWHPENQKAVGSSGSAGVLSAEARAAVVAAC